ncbi:MAG: hypothetical protein ACREDM_13180 [Methylocella sp.]
MPSSGFGFKAPAAGKTVVKRRLRRPSRFFRRQEPCLVGMGAAGTRIRGPVRHARTRATKDAEWTRALLARGPAKAVAVALANKTARMVWAVMARGEPCRAKEIAGQAA